MPVTRSDVDRMARLAQLALTEQEAETFTRQLADILGYAERIQSLETGGVAPSSHSLLPASAWREDEPGESLTRDEVLRQAPESAEGLFKVPKVIP